MKRIEKNRKSGGRTKKEVGGPMVGAAKMMEDAVKTSGVPGRSLNPTSKSGDSSPAMPYKKGGKAKWEGSDADEAQDKKLAKKHGMSMKEWESSQMDEKHDKQKSAEGLKKGGRTKKQGGGAISAAARDLESDAASAAYRAAARGIEDRAISAG